ncbi:hypothetical protein PO124_23195 [Bacillus licheniformis]|nr:hypothetical protein [Bacillus licheniformis]
MPSRYSPTSARRQFAGKVKIEGDRDHQQTFILIFFVLNDLTSSAAPKISTMTANHPRG